jgi:hypothetical protein
MQGLELAEGSEDAPGDIAMVCLLLAPRASHGLTSICRRMSYKPHEVTWDDVAEDGATGKQFVMEHLDKHGRPVVVMRPRYCLCSGAVLPAGAGLPCSLR